MNITGSKKQISYANAIVQKILDSQDRSTEFAKKVLTLESAERNTKDRIVAQAGRIEARIANDIKYGRPVNAADIITSYKNLFYSL